MKKSFQFIFALFLIVSLLCSQRIEASLQASCNVYPDRGLAVSPDGKFVVANWYTVALTSNTDKQYFTLWEIETGKTVATFELDPGFRGLAFSPNSRLLALADSDKVIVWDIVQKKIILTAEWDQKYDSKIFIPVIGTGVIFSPNSELLLMYGSIGEYLWDIKTGKLLHQIPVSIAVDQENISLSPDGKRLITQGANFNNGDDNERSVWDVETGKQVQLFDYGFNITFSPDGKYIAAELRGAEGLDLWDAHTYELVHRFEPPENGFFSDYSASFSPHGKYLAISTNTNNAGKITAGLEIWNLDTFELTHQFAVNRNVILVPQFLSNNKYMVTLDWYYGDTRVFRLWDLGSGKQLQMFSIGDDYGVLSAVVLLDNKHIAMTLSRRDDTGHSVVQLWDLFTGKKVREYC
jgi:WD40 repeat protein